MALKLLLLVILILIIFAAFAAIASFRKADANAKIALELIEDFTIKYQKVTDEDSILADYVVSTINNYRQQRN